MVSAASTSSNRNDELKTTKLKQLHLPMSRVRTIMKSTPDIENIGWPSLHIVAKATVRVTVIIKTIESTKSIILL